jgi:hypothetical protein
MKAATLLASALLAATAAAADAATLVAWDLFGQPGNQVSTPATSAATGLIGLPVTRGSGLSPSAASNSMSSSGWDGSDAGDYFSFGFTVDAGAVVDLDELIIATRSSATGPGAIGLYFSVIVSEVPVPAAVWLLGSGLLALAGLGRRRAR